MYFEGRELKPYAEPVQASELIEGEAYYSVTFVDGEMHIPDMDTLVFIGKNLNDGDSDSLYFQDIDSHRKGVQYDSATEDDHAVFVECSSGELNNIFEYERMLETLMRCSLLRNDK